MTEFTITLNPNDPSKPVFLGLGSGEDGMSCLFARQVEGVVIINYHTQAVIEIATKSPAADSQNPYSLAASALSNFRTGVFFLIDSKAGVIHWQGSDADEKQVVAERMPGSYVFVAVCPVSGLVNGARAPHRQPGAGRQTGQGQALTHKPG